MALNIWGFSLDKAIVGVKKKKKERMNERKNDGKPTKNTNTSLTSFGRLNNSWKQIKLSVWILYILTFNSLHVYFWQITCNKYIKIQLVAVKIWSRSHSKMWKFFWLQSHPILANSNMNNVCFCYQFTVPKWSLLFLYISGIDSYFPRACFIFPWGIKSVCWRLCLNSSH